MILPCGSGLLAFDPGFLSSSYLPLYKAEESFLFELLVGEHGGRAASFSERGAEGAWLVFYGFT